MRDSLMHGPIRRRKFLAGLGVGALGTMMLPATALADKLSVDIGNWSVDTTLDWLRSSGNEVLDLRRTGWNDVGSDLLVTQGRLRGPAEVKGTSSTTRTINYEAYAGWYDRSKLLSQRDPAYAVDRLYKVANSHPDSSARQAARQMLVDASRGTINCSLIEVHGVGGASPRVHVAGREPILPRHFSSAFGSPRPIFAPALQGVQAVCSGLFYLAIAADTVGAVERFMEIEDSFDRGQIDSIEREQFHCRSLFRRVGTWASAIGAAQVGGLLAAALFSNPGGWAILATLGIVGASSVAGALIGRWGFEELGTRTLRFVHEMGGSLSSLIDRGKPVIEIVHRAIHRCKQTASSVLVTAQEIARALWEAVTETLTQGSHNSARRLRLT